MVESLGPRRVKVYELRGEVWVDLGTGFCQGFVENVLLALSQDFTDLSAERGISKSHQRRNPNDRVVEL